MAVRQSTINSAKNLKQYIRKRHEYGGNESAWGDYIDREDDRDNTRDKIKVIVSGHIVEVYRFDYGVKTGSNNRFEPLIDHETGEVLVGWQYLGNNAESEEREGRSKEETKKYNARAAKNNLRRVILSNFGRESKFITLTFRDGSVSDVTSVEECNKSFKEFMRKLRRKFGNFKYVCVIEFQDTNGRGAVHYHMISELSYVSNKTLSEIWGNGFVKITKIDHVDNVGAYVSKYMVKDFADMRLAGKKAYWTSRGLVRPVVLYGNDAEQIVIEYLQEKKEVFSNSYESEYQGKTTYHEYNLERDV